ncbi:MAG: acetyl-CoA carboxylase biotin carboxyl carrier protein subunit [Acidaminococcaceae bacterium]
MFNNDIKEECLNRLKIAENEYVKERESVEKSCLQLFETRKEISDKIIKPVEEYINTIANVPVELVKSVSELKVNYANFAEVFKMEKEYSDRVEKLAGKAIGGGLVIGAGVGALAPAGAMAVATTFGTASTGAAIASLHGAAAANAALAWLGGGSVAAGGGGIVAGKALLAMAGPIGWGIAGIGIIAGSWWKSNENKKTADRAYSVAKKYEMEGRALTEAKAEIEQIESSTVELFRGVSTQLDYLIMNAPKNYGDFKDTDDKELMALINNIRSLSEFLNKRVVSEKAEAPEIKDYEYVFIHAPMPGYVKELFVKEGQEVEKGEAIINLYAMRLDNNIVAPQAGKIVEITVSEKESVKPGGRVAVLAKK